MLARIATDVEQDLHFVNDPAELDDETHALSEALNVIDSTLKLKYIISFTETGYTATIASGERPTAPVVAFTPNERVYHWMNLIWGRAAHFAPNLTPVFRIDGRGSRGSADEA